LNPLGFDPIGLDNNLPQAEGLIEATLLQGDYYVGHSYSWTQFDVDKRSQQLTVTTWGIPGYTEAELTANPKAIAAQAPVILSQFVVNPQAFDDNSGDDLLKGTIADDTLRGGKGDDTLLGLGGDDLLRGNAGSDFISGGAGSDRLIGGNGFDTLKGGAGEDQFLVNHSNQKADRILDFEVGTDLGSAV
jgi:Ca2+-binding RTX toxin-like protein